MFYDLLKQNNELQRYEVSQIVDIAKAMFRSSSTPPKGLVTASKGVEHPLVIGESSNSRNGYSDLRSKISSLFSLQQRVDQADETESVQIRKAFKLFERNLNYGINRSLSHNR